MKEPLILEKGKEEQSKVNIISAIQSRSAFRLEVGKPRY